MGKLLWTGTIKGNPITKKNHQQIAYKWNKAKTKKVPFIRQSDSYKAYEEMAGWFLKRPVNPIAKPINVKCIYFMETDGAVDLVNLQEATLDILQKYRIIENDESGFVRSMDGSRVHKKDKNPRVEIEITTYE